MSAIDKECSQSMTKCVDYLKDELRGVRTGQATPGLVDHIKIEVQSYGSTMELRELAGISVPEPAVILVKPFDPGTIKDIEKGLLTADIGMTPRSDGKTIRLPVPALSGERRQQLVQQIKKMAEAQKVAIRNVRRDMNKKIDADKKSGTLSEDQAEDAKSSVQNLTKKFEGEIDKLIADKTIDIEAD
jgi:ribosome recycling factor